MGSNGNGPNITIASLPWSRSLYNWYPFKIDALGLVTLLGGEEINAALGRLVPSRYLEYFPLLGAYVFAGDRFKDKLPSFHLYNITDGITTTDLSSWLTRWMLEQDFEPTRSIVQFDMMDKPRSWARWHLLSALLSSIFISFLIVMTVLIGDWYGLANAGAMIVSVLVRGYALQAHRNAIDRAAVKATNDAIAQNRPIDSMKACMTIMSDSRVVTLLLPGHLIVPIFSYNPEPRSPLLYHCVRFIGWAFFGVHIVTIGMAQLLPQLYTVALMVIPTVLICWKLGCDDSHWKVSFSRRIRGVRPNDHVYECWIGTRIRATVFEWPIDVEFEQVPVSGEKKMRWARRTAGSDIPSSKRSTRRQDLYAWLHLSRAEEESLGKWDLFPHTRNGNESWWETYEAKKALITERPQMLARRTTENRVAMKNVESEMERANGIYVTTTPVDAAHTLSHSSSYSSSRFRTFLTTNGFVASVPSASTAFASAGMGAAGVGMNTNYIPDQLTPLLHRRGDSHDD